MPARTIAFFSTPDEFETALQRGSSVELLPLHHKTSYVQRRGWARTSICLPKSLIGDIK